MLSRPRAAAAVLSLLILAACDEDGAVGGPSLADTAAGDPAIDDGPGAALPLAGLDGLTIRRVGLVRFDVLADTVPDALADAPGESPGEEDFGLYPAPASYTEARASFTALAAPLDAAELAQVTALLAPAEGCAVIGEGAPRSVEAYVRATGEPVYAGEVLAVSRAAGSWFELHGAGEAAAGYRQAGASEAVSGRQLAVGEVREGTLLDIPGGAFPAFAAVAVPPVAALTGVGTSAVELTWDAGEETSVPVVVDITFSGFVSPKQTAERAGAAEGPARIPYPADELPEAIRCVTRDTGRFVMPEAVRETILGARALSVGSATVTERVDISRLATRHRVAGDALLIVQSGNGGAL